MLRLASLVGATALAALSAGEPESAEYTVTFYGVPCADVQATISALGGGREELRLTAATRDWIDYFASVDNSYTTVYDRRSFHLQNYEKDIEQWNLKQKLEIEWDPRKGLIRSGKASYRRERPTHNIFSLLMRARTMTAEKIDTQWWEVDHEGVPMRARLLWIDSPDMEFGGKSVATDHYRLDLRETAGETAILADSTDIFSWGVALGSCVRQVWVERKGSRRIVMAEVDIGGIKLRAKLKDD